jgi:hypothetical protein
MLQKPGNAPGLMSHNDLGKSPADFTLLEDNFIGEICIQ